MILYKCHLFGVSPPALTSTLVPSAGSAGQPQLGAGSLGLSAPHHPQHSSAAWRAHEIFQLTGYSGANSASALNSAARSRNELGATSDCSLCANVERKYQCVWCQNQCQHQDSCLDGHQITIGSSGCPPPRIDSVSYSTRPVGHSNCNCNHNNNDNDQAAQPSIHIVRYPARCLLGPKACKLIRPSAQQTHNERVRWASELASN